MSDLLAIVAIAIGVGGSIAMGIFQVKEGVDALFGLRDTGTELALGIFVALCLAFTAPLVVDLSRGMAVLSNAAMLIVGSLMVFVPLAGPAHFLMGGIVQAFGEYISGAVVHGFRTFTFMDERVDGWFQSWTLTYMVWWIAWAPFVGVFIARISRGRTIREFLCGVMLVPTTFSILWFGVFGGVGFFDVLRRDTPLLRLVDNNASAVTFFIFEQFPAPTLTIAAVVVAAFLFVVTSVVSAAFVLGMFTTGGDLNPSVRVKLELGRYSRRAGIGDDSLRQHRGGEINHRVRRSTACLVMLLLVICLLKALKTERLAQTCIAH